MRNGQNKQRMRGRNRKGQNPMSRVYESNGPDVKIRGTPNHIADKYIQLARDAHTSGDPIAAENYYQHAEHYFRLIAAAQEQFRQNNPNFYRAENEVRGAADDAYEEGEDDSPPAAAAQGDVPFGTREPQPYLPPDVQPFPREQPQPINPRPQHQRQASNENAGDVDRLPSFITGGAPQPQQAHQPQQNFSQNGHDTQGGDRNQGGDRFPLHRRHRRHRGPRPDAQGGGRDRDESSPRE
jgi:hypothetical protein